MTSITSPHDGSTHPAEMVDGALKHTLNSEGRSIHPTAEGRANFHRWAVDGGKGLGALSDKHGRPLILYHGTTAQHFNKFDPRLTGSSSPSDHPNAVSLTTSPDVAAGYAGRHWRVNADKTDTEQAFNAHGRIIPAYVRVKGGATHYNMFGGAYDPAVASRGMRGARKDGHNVVMISNVRDPADASGSLGPSAHVVYAFNAGDIKSATGNNGSFSKSRSDVTETVALNSGEASTSEFSEPLVSRIDDFLDEQAVHVITSPHDGSTHPAEMVAGALKHTLNSEGRSIHPTVEGRASFHNWHAGSKVVDEHGRPKVVYHGTRSPDAFKEFGTGSHFDADGETRISGCSDPTAHVGPHFADTADVAGNFALGKAHQWDKDRFVSGDGHGGRVMPVYLHIKNPDKMSDEGFQHSTYEHGTSHTLDAHLDDMAEREAENQDSEEEAEHSRNREFDPEEKQHIHLQVTSDEAHEGTSERETVAQELGHSYRSHLEKHGHDGVRYKNDIEGGHAWVPLHGHQIKSATGNNGSFSKSSRDMTETASLSSYRLLGTQSAGTCDHCGTNLPSGKAAVVQKLDAEGNDDHSMPPVVMGRVCAANHLAPKAGTTHTASSADNVVGAADAGNHAAAREADRLSEFHVAAHGRGEFGTEGPREARAAYGMSNGVVPSQVWKKDGVHFGTMEAHPAFTQALRAAGWEKHGETVALKKVKAPPAEFGESLVSRIDDFLDERAGIDLRGMRFFHGTTKDFKGPLNLDHDTEGYQAAGPGIYFTSNTENANHYATPDHADDPTKSARVFHTTVVAKPSRILTDKTRSTPARVHALISAAPQEHQDELAQNFGHKSMTPAAMRTIVPAYLDTDGGSFMGSSHTLHRDLFRKDTRMWGAAMHKVGFDGAHVETKQDGDKHYAHHFIAYHPSAVSGGVVEGLAESDGFDYADTLPLPKDEAELAAAVAHHKSAETAAVAQHGRGSDEAFKHYMAHLNLPSRYYRIKNREHVLASPNGVSVFNTEYDMVHVIHPSTSPDNKGGYRITHYSKSFGGPTGHAEGVSALGIATATGRNSEMAFDARPVPHADAKEFMKKLTSGSMKESLNEAVQGIRRYLDGRHQVTDLGRHGNFHIHSVMPVRSGDHQEASSNLQSNFGDKYTAHLKQIHSVKDYKKNTGGMFLKDTHADEIDTKAPEFSGHWAHSARTATESLGDAGLPHQVRHLVIAPMEGDFAYNRNTGKHGDVSGHWHKAEHVIRVKRDLPLSTEDRNSLLTHEWAHAYHDEMSKPQKSAWKDFYHKHVVQGSIPSGTGADHDAFVKHVTDTVSFSEPIKSIRRDIESRSNYHNPSASVFDSVHTGQGNWWEGLHDSGQLDHGIVAQSGKRMPGVDRDTGGKVMLSHKHYSVVKSMNPVTHRDLVTAHNIPEDDIANHVVIHPLNKPNAAAVYRKSSIVSHGAESMSGGSVALWPDEQRTHALHKARGVAHSALHMTQKFKDEVEVTGKAKTFDDFYQHHMGKGRTGQLGGVLYNAHEEAHKKFPGISSSVKDAGFSGQHSHGDDLLQHIVHRAATAQLAHNATGKHQDIIHSAIKSSVENGSYPVKPLNMPRTLQGTEHEKIRNAAHTDGRVASPYGASNDHELFATTVEHLARHHALAKRAPINKLHPNHRALVKAWQHVISGGGTKGLPERIDAFLSTAL